ncbi:hypothetical protein [Marinobacterium marinum]|uniref:Uncharacterized protein n=1 Tax=Marinobacterium marinum TaxID=2756129 RepID=A0A7W1WVV1_9GAMM|nr:hypothetical protein [Marinobacterium marinum]MBA4501185.1 hypothetical protein [Marinobacterium marinum]
MRNLEVLASQWCVCLPDESFELAVDEQLLTLECCRYEGWRYQRLALQRGDETFYYLYAMSEEGVWVLGVFDTPGQADFFLALHNEDPLMVPALLQPVLAGDAVRVEQGKLCYPRYEGLYRVGFKSYQVAVDQVDAGLRTLLYVERYNSQGLGVLPEKEACLKIYSHFDGRLRGCKMC